MLKELRGSLEAEREAERSRLEAQKRREVEQLKVEVEAGLRPERRSPREEGEETRRHHQDQAEALRSDRWGEVVVIGQAGADEVGTPGLYKTQMT